jgi:hypothetical protein
MVYKKRVLFFLLITMLAACGAPPAMLPPAPDMNQLNTAIAQTAGAAMALTLQAASPTFTPTVTPTDTVTPSFTPTPTSTPTLTIPTDFATPTPQVAQIIVSVTTNCRSGPGKVYAYQSALSKGVISEVLAVDPTGKYWYIPNPESPGEFCWVWGEYATVSGNTAALPVYTPPPSPTATITLEPAAATKAASGSGGSGGSDDEPKTGSGEMGPGYGPRPKIQLSYMGLDTCAGEWWVEFNLANISQDFDVRSIEMKIFDSDSQATASILADGFKNVNGCSDDFTENLLRADSSLVVSSPALPYDPTGHEIELTVRVCKAISQGTPCSVKEKIEFVP